MKCDELKAFDMTVAEEYNYKGIVKYRRADRRAVYNKSEVDEAIAELKAENEQLKAENEQLKAKLESVQASAYADSVDAGMRERRLKRALWLLKTRYFWILMAYASDLAKVANPSIIHKSNFLDNPTPRCMEEYQHEAELYDNARIKCLKKAEEYR